MTTTPVERTQIAKITDTFLGANEDTHGVLTATLTVDYGGAGQTIGGYNLSSKTTAFGMQFVKALMGAAGADSWEQMKGKTILVITDSDRPYGKVIGIQNLPTERGGRFIFDELAAGYSS